MFTTGQDAAGTCEKGQGSSSSRQQGGGSRLTAFLCDSTICMDEGPVSVKAVANKKAMPNFLSLLIHL